MTDQQILTEIVKSYRPYDTIEAFREGFVGYQNGALANPYDGQPAKGVQAQAWDRGAEAAMRYERAVGR